MIGYLMIGAIIALVVATIILTGRKDKK